MSLSGLTMLEVLPERIIRFLAEFLIGLAVLLAALEVAHKRPLDVCLRKLISEGTISCWSSRCDDEIDFCGVELKLIEKIIFELVLECDPAFYFTVGAFKELTSNF